MDNTLALQRAPGAVEALVDDQVVLLSPIDFSYHALDPVGARIWELLKVPMSLDQVIEALTAMYSIDESTCRADVVPFIDRMTEIGVISVTQ